MRHITIVLALFCGTYTFSQVEQKVETKVPVKKELKSTGKKSKKKTMKATKIDRPVIDKYTKPREASGTKKENK